MPHIRCRGLELVSLKKISTPLIDGLTEIVGCDRSWFTLEMVETKFISDGEEVAGYPFVEVLWFDRGQEAKSKSAKLITDLITNEGEFEAVTVLFNDLKGKNYYEDGEHF